jgi:hypothetical protein
VNNLSDLHEGCIVKLPFVSLYEIELADQSPLYLKLKGDERIRASLSDTVFVAVKVPGNTKGCVRSSCSSSAGSVARCGVYATSQS